MFGAWIQHCISFFKTRTWRKLCFQVKIATKIQVLKIRNLQFPAQCHFPAWATNCQESNLHLLQNFQPPWPISQTLRWKNASIWNHSVLQNGELSFPNGRNSIYLFLFSQNPKCWFIEFYSVSVYKRNKHCRTLYRQRATSLQSAEITQENCNFHSTKCSINVNDS